MLLLAVGLGYGLAWMSTVPSPVSSLLPSLGLSSLGLGGGTAAPAKGGGGAGATPPPAARRSGPRDGSGGPGMHSAPPPPPHTPSGSGPGMHIAPPPPHTPSGSGPRMHSAPPPPTPSGSGPGTGMHRAPPPPKQPDTQKSPPEDGSADTGKAAAPPSCWPCGSVEQKDTRRVMLLLGCVISLLSFTNPVIIYWSLGSSLPETISFHSLWDLIATAAGCLAWLLFAITQLHVEGKEVLGVESIVINLVGFSLYTLCTLVKIAGGAANVQTKGCIGAIVALCGPTFIVICFVVFGPIKRDSVAATWISYGAALMQVLSQCLPFRSLCLLCRPPADVPAQAQHANTKKLIIYSRSCNLIVCVYWAMYCVFTYQHNYFEFANVIGAVFALITFALHLIYALEPQAEKKQRTGAKRSANTVEKSVVTWNNSTGYLSYLVSAGWLAIRML